jgi:hypothetical protein
VIQRAVFDAVRAPPARPRAARITWRIGRWRNAFPADTRALHLERPVAGALRVARPVAGAQAVAWLVAAVRPAAWPAAGAWAAAWPAAGAWAAAWPAAGAWAVAWLAGAARAVVAWPAAEAQPVVRPAAEASAEWDAPLAAEAPSLAAALPPRSAARQRPATAKVSPDVTEAGAVRPARRQATALSLAAAGPEPRTLMDRLRRSVADHPAKAGPLRAFRPALDRPGPADPGGGRADPEPPMPTTAMVVRPRPAMAGRAAVSRPVLATRIEEADQGRSA